MVLVLHTLSLIYQKQLNFGRYLILCFCCYIPTINKLILFFILVGSTLFVWLESNQWSSSNRPQVSCSDTYMGHETTTSWNVCIYEKVNTRLSTADPIHIQAFNLVITASADALAPKPSTNRALTLRLEIIFFTDFLDVDAFEYLFTDHTLFKMIIEITRYHDDVIKWKHFPRYWPFVRGIHRSPVNSLHKGQRRGALMFSLICVWINGWENNHEAGDLRRYRSH